MKNVKKDNLNKKIEQNKKTNNNIINLTYVLIIIFMVAYIATQSIIFGFLSFALIIATLFLEFKSSVTEEGTKKTIIDIGIVLVVVIILFWVIPTIVLQSSSPINVVASCSMLPSIQRGDLVLVHGISNMSSFLSENKIPVIKISQNELLTLFGNITQQFIYPFPYIKGNPSEVLLKGYYTNASKYQIGLYNVECIDGYLSKGLSKDLSQCLANTYEKGSIIQYNYSIANLSYQNTIFKEPYISSIKINNTVVYENYSNPVIVYKTIPGDSFTDSQIVHRVFAALQVNNTYYILTKGDNNQILDIEDMNYPPNQTQIIGYVALTIPFLGYPSLIIKGQFGSVPGCNETILR
ncbi:MAG: hypothetical protein ACP5M9_02070 [Candidatus Micrarchaeia archaeon]